MYQNSAWGKHQGERAVTGMRYLDTVLSQRPYLAGDAFSMADITVFAGLSFADFAKIAVPADLRHLIDWQKRVASRPSVAAA